MERTEERKEAAIGMVSALAGVFVTGLLGPPGQTAPGGGRRAAERILTYTGVLVGGISAWFMKATGRAGEPRRGCWT